MAPSSRQRARVLRRTLVIGLAAGAPALVACNALLGLDEYDKTVCNGGRCDGGTADVTQDVQSDRVVVQTDAAGTQPVAWAQFKMPNYDAGADVRVDNPLDYQVDTDRIVDKVTNLTWREPETADTADMTFTAARAACTGEWRLPTRIELVTLLDLGQTNAPRVDARFASMKRAEYWTSSEVRPYDDQRRARWTVVFDPGRSDVLGQKAESETARVRCIKVN